MKREIVYSLEVGKYTMYIQPSHLDRRLLMFSLSWNDNGKIQHEGSCKMAELEKALADMKGNK